MASSRSVHQPIGIQLPAMAYPEVKVVSPSLSSLDSVDNGGATLNGECAVYTLISICKCVCSNYNSLIIPLFGLFSFVIVAKYPSRHNSKASSNISGGRLNKFVRRLHDMLTAEHEGGVVEWRRGLLVLHNIGEFTKTVLPQYFNTRNFKTFRRQLNYYGFVHVRSFAASGTTTTALWVNQELADTGDDTITSVLRLKRVEPNEASKTPEGRRVRKNEAACSVEVDEIVGKTHHVSPIPNQSVKVSPTVPTMVHCRYGQQPPPLSLYTSSRMCVYSQPAYHHEVMSTPTISNIDEAAAKLLLCLSRATD
jgi:hypothetical protein